MTAGRLLLSESRAHCGSEGDRTTQLELKLEQGSTLTVVTGSVKVGPAAAASTGKGAA